MLYYTYLSLSSPNPSILTLVAGVVMGAPNGRVLFSGQNNMMAYTAYPEELVASFLAVYL